MTVARRHHVAFNEGERLPFSLLTTVRLQCFCGPFAGSRCLPCTSARGKVAYNVESHVNFGSLRMHQRMLGLSDLLGDWLPQIGLGVKGFLFWQFRPELFAPE